MKDAADNFLRISGELYDVNKRKWRKIIKEKGYEFSEDIYNDSILKTYEAILKKEIDTTDYIGYWFQSFINNTKREELYARSQLENNDVDVYEYLKDVEYDESKAPQYHKSISSILIQVFRRFTRVEYETFRLYLLCNMSYEEIDKLTNINSKHIIKKIKKWLHENRQKLNY